MAKYGKTALIVLLVTIFCSSVLAESEFVCGTRAGFQEQHQPPIVTSEVIENTAIDNNTPIKHLTLSIYVARNSDGTNPASNDSLVEQAVRQVNDRFLPHRIQFDYEWKYIDDDGLRSVVHGFLSPTFGDLNPDKIHILVTKTTPSYSWQTGASIYMNENTFINERNVLIHEIGHGLSLYHTFRGALGPLDTCYNPNYTPLADNSNCEHTGDFCCDTPTYPAWNSCAFPEGIGGNDPCTGIPWGTIDDRNYMSYINDECREEFTPQQSVRMHNYLNYRKNLWYLDLLLVPLQYASIQNAIDEARDGDLILVEPGVYQENIEFSGKRIIVRSMSGNPENTIIQAVDPSFPAVTIDFGEPNTTPVLDGFTITSSQASGIKCESSSPKIINNIIENNKSNCDSCGAGIDISNTHRATITNNIIRNNEAMLHGAAIHADSCTATIIINNLIYANKGAVEIYAIASNLIVYNNTIDGSSSNSHALSNQDRGATLECRNNNFVNASKNGVFTNGIDISGVEYNNFFNCGDGALGGDYYHYDTLTNLEVDPVWAIEPCLDEWYCYIIDSINSPLIGAGSTRRSHDGSSINIGWRSTLNFDIPTDVGSVADVILPSAYQLSQNYPNPFNPSTTIVFVLPNPGNVELAVFNLLGQTVVTLFDKFLPAGSHIIEWDGTSQASGIYLYRLKTESYSETKKMVLLK